MHFIFIVIIISKWHPREWDIFYLCIILRIMLFCFCVWTKRIVNFNGIFHAHSWNNSSFNYLKVKTIYLSSHYKWIDLMLEMVINS